MKSCSRSNVGKECFGGENPQPIENFAKAKNRNDGLTAYCKSCLKHFREVNKDSRNAAILSWRKRNPEKMKAYRAAKSEHNTNRMRKWRENNRLKFLYNISNEDWAAMFVRQEGKCLICLKHATELKRGLAIDHCHNSGKVRGLLCHICNQAIGMFKENIDIMARAIHFLEKNKDQ